MAVQSSQVASLACVVPRPQYSMSLYACKPETFPKLYSEKSCACRGWPKEYTYKCLSRSLCLGHGELITGPQELSLYTSWDGSQFCFPDHPHLPWAERGYEDPCSSASISHTPANMLVLVCYMGTVTQETKKSTPACILLYSI